MTYSDPRVVCAPWVTPADMCCAGPQTDTDCSGTPIPLTNLWTDDELIRAASNLLYARTCYRYPGLCQSEVWPCAPCWSCGCEASCCTCGPWRKMRLPTDYPIDSIVSVTIDGVPMNPADYRLDNDYWLVRLDGQSWPTANSFADPASGTSEFRVEYIYGRQPPIELQMAAAELACELKKACEGSQCSLPPHVTNVTRRGVEYEIQDVTALLSGGLTGNPIIDHALKVHGNCSSHGRLVDPLEAPRGYRVT